MPASQPGARAQVLNYLAYSWVDQNMNIDEAFKMLKQAVDASPRDGMIIDSLGWAYFRLGRWDEALRELEKAIELKPGDPTINDHLGDAYWRAGRRLEGKFQWQHAKDLNPEPDDLAKINDKLKNGLPEIEKPTAAQIRKSVTPDHLISFLDGKPYRSLKRHLTSQGMTPAEYRQKFGLPHDYPMVAASYAAARSELAKNLGLGQIRRDRAAARRAEAAEPAAIPARRGRPKKADTAAAE